MRITTWVMASVAAAFAVPLWAQGQPLDNPAAAFGARESVRAVAISPDGDTIAYVAAGQGQSASVYAIDLATGEGAAASYSSGEPLSYQWCNFSGDDRLVCALYGVLPAASALASTQQLIAIGSDGENPVTLGQRQSAYALYRRQYDGEVIDWMPLEDDVVLMARYHVPEANRVNTRLVDTDEGLGVDRVDTASGRARSIESPKPEIGDYMSDGRGNVRISGAVPMRGATGRLGSTIVYHYRRQGESEWLDLASYDMLARTGFHPLAIDPELDSVYGIERLDGRDALYRMSLDGSLRRELVLANDAVDVDSVMRLGPSGRVIGASLAEDRRRIEYFDDEYRALAEALSQALPGPPLINFVGASANENILLIWAGSDSDPGRYYTYNKATRNLNEIMVARPALEHAQLATMRAISFPAADGTNIPGYLTMPPGREDARGLPAIVMPHGGPSARDEWGFDWLAQYFAHQGYAVLQPNFRGSAGYGNDWFVINGFQGWETAIGDVDAGGRWLVSEGIADPERLGILGWSYGGYAALQSGVLDPGLFKAIVAIAPVTDLDLLRDDARFYTSAANVREFIGEGPHIRAGSPAQNAERIAAPVLLFHGDRDVNVDVGHARLMRDRLEEAGKPVDYVEFEGLDHQLDDTAARAQLLERSDAFLRAAFGMPALALRDRETAEGQSGEEPVEPEGPVFPGAVVPEGAADEDGEGG